MKVDVSVVQTHPAFGQVDANIKMTLAMLSRRKSDVYVLPELAMTGYNFDTKEQVADLAESSGRGRTFEALQAFAAKNAAYIAYGFIEKAAGGFYNSASLVGPQGLIGTYRKTHLFSREKLFFLPGDTGFSVYELPWGRVGMMVCFDWYFPEAARTLAIRGAQLILHPSNLVLPNCPEGMLIRCLENRVFAATANRIGTENGGEKPLTYIGLSEIVSPSGEILVRLEKNEVGVGTAACDLDVALVKALNPHNDLFKDRQPGMYAT